MNFHYKLGYNLPAKYVIHTVGPVGEYPDLLASCYRNSIELAIENNCQTIVRSEIKKFKIVLVI